MVNVKVVTLVDLKEETPQVLAGETVYEEDFNKLGDFDIREVMGSNLQVIVTIGSIAQQIIVNIGGK